MYLNDVKAPVKMIKKKIYFFVAGTLCTIALLSCRSQAELNNDLQVAVLNNNFSSVIKALKSGADANFRRTLDAPLLVTAIANKNDEIAVQLVLHNANITEKISQDESLFLAAVRHGLIQTVKALLQKGIDIDQKNNRAETGLIIAAKQKNSEMALELIKNNAHVFATDRQGGNALFWATVNRNTETAKYIQEFTKEINTAVVLANFNNVAELEKQSAAWKYMNFNSRDFWSRTLLTNAAFLNKPDVVKWLLQKNVNKETKDYFNLTAKDYAQRNKSQRILNLLEGKDDIVEVKDTPKIQQGGTANQGQTNIVTNNTATKTKTQEELDKEEFERKKRIMEALREKDDTTTNNTTISNDYDE